MVQPEGTRTVWGQVTGFGFLADLLEEQYRLWRAKRDRITEAWQSPAAEQFLLRLDVYGQDLLIDAVCARQTGYALDRTVSALERARDQIYPLVSEWDMVTGDWKPEWWDHAADKLNQQARQIMAETDRALAASRPYISAPGEIGLDKGIERRRSIDGEPAPTEVGGQPTPSGGSSVSSRPRVPPVPGYDPLARDQGAPELTALGGAPQPVPVFPSQPVSMLPIPPGSPYAPFGGAYILPGPGVGRGGYVVPMPQNPGVGGRPPGPRTLMPPAPGGVGGVGGVAPGGMMPVPMSGTAGGGGGHGAIYRRPNVTWQTDKGVPPVIRIEDDEFVPDQPSRKQEEQFQDWFTDMAYPWRAEFKNSEGARVTIREVPQ